ncbi:MAG: hypothetical protein HOI95_08320, partial [Chromatiales bacterium]|nr:hypothetical protein [Chromatiales bacterium]
MAQLTQMLDLKDRVVQFSRDELSMADLKRECLRLAEADDSHISQILGILTTAREAGLLSPSEFGTLSYVMSSVVAAADSQDVDDDSTIVDDDSTIVDDNST